MNMLMLRVSWFLAFFLLFLTRPPRYFSINHGIGLAPTLHLPPNHPVRSPYHYIPSEGVAITFIVLFSLSTIIHLGQSAKYRVWWLLPTVCLCGVLEIIGWSARLWSSFTPAAKTPFEMQITATILGPTPFLAVNFIILGKIIERLGVQYSRLKPQWYAGIFLTCDIISLVVQGVGGGIAASAFGRNQDPTNGGHIMLGGIAFQFLTISVFFLCATEFFLRYLKDWPVREVASTSQEDVKIPVKPPMTLKLKVMSAGLALSTLFLFIRAVYRTIELSDGWNGRIISTQVLFNVLDGGMITLAMYSLNLPVLGFC
ncbi:RTA1 like protein-domain-containing protein [Cyathus striatus]|nr:RTA1 like protein-domain-containing protein [Cyathus striatus]